MCIPPSKVRSIDDVTINDRCDLPDSINGEPSHKAINEGLRFTAMPPRKVMSFVKKSGKV